MKKMIFNIRGIENILVIDVFATKKKRKVKTLGFSKYFPLKISKRKIFSNNNIKLSTYGL